MTHYERLYLILRPMDGNGGGHARLEQRGNRVQANLFLHGLETRRKLRILIFSALDAQGAVVDLGTLETGDQGQGTLIRTGIALPGDASISSLTALAVCEDWPGPRLLMAAPVGARPMPARWALQEAIDRYLNVPVELPAEAPEPPAPPPPAPKEPDPPRPVDDLPVLQWPEALSELKVYFELLSPCAPLDAPGWRFVRAPLPHGAPGPVCFIGIRPLDSRIAQIAYALPAGASEDADDELRGFIPETGRHQKEYLVLRQGH